MSDIPDKGAIVETEVPEKLRLSESKPSLDVEATSTLDDEQHGEERFQRATSGGWKRPRTSDYSNKKGNKKRTENPRTEARKQRYVKIQL